MENETLLRGTGRLSRLGVACALIALSSACGSTSKNSNTALNPDLGAAGNASLASVGQPTYPGTGQWCDALAVLKSPCQTCHGTQRLYGAPMSLVTYDDLQKPAVSDPTRKVYQLVRVRIHDVQKPMPPQGFASLTPVQLGALDSWIDAGALAGADPTCASPPGTTTGMPSNTQPPPQTTPGSGTGTGTPPTGTTPPPTTGTTGTAGSGDATATGSPTTTMMAPPDCDMHYKILAGNGMPVAVPAGTEQHPSFFSTPTWPANSQGILFTPITDNAKVLHHWILYSGDGAFITGWAPGNDGARNLPPDVGMYLPSGAGAQLRLDVHYNNLGGTATEMDQSGVDICVISTPSKLRKNIATVYGLTAPANAPAHQANYSDEATCTVSASMGPVTILDGSPHMHKLGVHAKLVWTHGGMQQVVHDLPFSFDEQRIYDFTPPLISNTGDQFTVTCTYTNNTDQNVTFGPNTEDEMCFNFVLYYPKGGFNCR